MLILVLVNERRHSTTNRKFLCNSALCHYSQTVTAHPVKTNVFHLVLSVTNRAPSAEWDHSVWHSWRWREKPCSSQTSTESSIWTTCWDSQQPARSKQPVGFFSSSQICEIFRKCWFSLLLCISNLSPLSLCQCCTWGCGAFWNFPGDCSRCCRDPSSSEPGLPSVEQNPGHTWRHGAHLPETHHRQYIDCKLWFPSRWLSSYS